MNISKIIFIIISYFISVNLMAANYCGELKNSIGPFDYREKIENDEALRLVEGRHFNAQHERLIEDNRGHIGGELSYTLRAFPNHHRALLAFGKLALKQKNPLPYGSSYSVECFLDRKSVV